MAFNIKGIVHAVFETKQVSDKLTKREFVVETADNPKYPQKISFEITGERCSQLDSVREGDTVSVDFDLRGREWRSPQGPIKYFNSLSAWKVEVTAAAAKATKSGGQSISPPAAGDSDDLPF